MSCKCNVLASWIIDDRSTISHDIYNNKARGYVFACHKTPLCHACIHVTDYALKAAACNVETVHILYLHIH